MSRRLHEKFAGSVSLHKLPLFHSMCGHLYGLLFTGTVENTRILHVVERLRQAISLQANNMQIHARTLNKSFFLR